MACPYTCVGKNICIYCAFTHRRRTPAAPARRRAQRADRQAPLIAVAIWRMFKLLRRYGKCKLNHRRPWHACARAPLPAGRIKTAASIKAAPQAYTATPMRPRWAKLAMPAPPTITPPNSAVQQTALVYLSSARPTAYTVHLPARQTACTAHLPARPTACAVHLPAQPTTCAVHLPARPTACAAHLPARPTTCAVHLPARPAAAHHMPAAFAQR